MNAEALRSEALLHAGKARTMAAKLFNDPQASQVDAGDLLISMAQLVDLLCLAGSQAAADRKDAERWRTFIGLPYEARADWATNISLAPVLTSWVDQAAKEQRND